MSLRVLLVEDSIADAAFAERALQVSDGEFDVTITGSLDAGIECLVEGFDAILLDLTLPDSARSDTVVRWNAPPAGGCALSHARRGQFRNPRPCTPAARDTRRPRALGGGRGRSRTRWAAPTPGGGVFRCGEP